MDQANSNDTKSEPKSWIVDVPIRAFASTMGILGLGLVLRSGADLLPILGLFAPATLWAGGTLFGVLTMIQSLRFILYPDKVRKDQTDLTGKNLSSSFSISILLIAEAVRPMNQGAAVALWIIGVTINVILAIRALRYWLQRPVPTDEINPTWFLPVVGNLVAPTIGVPLGLLELSWFIFGIGLCGWIMLLPIVMRRLLIQDRLPDVILPTIYIAISPPGLAASALLALVGPQAAMLAIITFSFGLFLFAVLLTLPILPAKGPFYISWWAYTFPVHAMSLASLALNKSNAIFPPQPLTLALVGLSILFTLRVAAMAVIAIIKGRK